MGRRGPTGRDYLEMESRLVNETEQTIEIDLYRKGNNSQ